METRFDSAFSFVLIYVFTIYDEAHKGCLKIGKATCKLEQESQYTSLLHPNASLLNRAAKKRIDSYTTTAGIKYSLLHTELAEKKVRIGKNIMLEYFSDQAVHEVLRNSGVENVNLQGSREWFRTDLDTVRKAIQAVKEGRINLTGSEISSDHIHIEFRPEQVEAIEMTVNRFKRHNKMLWYAKMRFGKTLSTLEVIKRMKFGKTIILTHRPVVDDSWGEDYQKIFWNTDFHYCKKGTPENNIKRLIRNGESFIFFASIQDLRGSDIVGGKFSKNSVIFNTEWDLVVVDEAHEGTKTSLGDDVLKEIIKEETYGKTKQIYLSGTPFNLLNDFEDDEVFTWDYIMEQRAKAEWDIIRGLDSNPYEGLPKLGIYTYDIADAIPGYENLEEKAFNFREFFRVWTGSVEKDGFIVPQDSGVGRFVHEKEVKCFLNLLCKNDAKSNYPFSKDEYRDYFRHTLWMLPGVPAAKALADLLEDHEIFGLFNIVNVAGIDPTETMDPLERVNAAISDHSEKTRTITLSCGRLTTGVTVKPWTAVLMLSGSNSTSASAYLQTIFRVQSPANINGRIKDRCFAFDFAPDRTLQMIAEAGKLGTRPGSYDSESEEKMKEFLNFCPVIAIYGSEMCDYDVQSMLRQLKKYYAARVARNGFDDIKLYNNNLLNLTELDKKKFDNLKKIVGAVKANDIKSKIVIAESGLGPEEQQLADEAQKKKRKNKVLSEEEKAALKKLQEAREAKSKAISILRAISIRIPLLVYGAEKDIDEDITIENFTEMIDDDSWIEFMPAGVTKAKFNEFIEYYDKDIFIEAGNQIRQKVIAADQLNPTDRVKKIVEVFNTFKNPDKETVLTPWRVVNMHIGDCLGGYVFYDDTYTDLLEEPRFIDRGQVTTKTVANQNAKILEINSKSGLYPLFIAYSIYRKRIAEYKDEEKTQELQDMLWDETIYKNVFIICKTKMAKFITKRTLLGYKVDKINAHYFNDLINQFQNKTSHVTKKIISISTWNKGGIGTMKFDAIVGNPPYQQSDAGNSTGSSSIYHLFVKGAIKIQPDYISLITPSRWFFGGKGLDGFRTQMLNDRHICRIVDYTNSLDCFSNVDIAGGVSYFLRSEKYDGQCLFTNISKGITNEWYRDLNEFDTLMRYPLGISIIKKVLSQKEDMLSSIVSARKPFGLPTNTKPNPNGELNLRYSKGIGKIRREDISSGIEIIDKWKVTISYLSSEHAGQPDNSGKYRVISSLEILPPQTVCTETYLVAGSFESEEMAKNYHSYFQTKFLRFLVAQVAMSQHITRNSFKYVPYIDYSKGWADNELYRKYKLNQEEINFIESMIKPI